MNTNLIIGVFIIALGTGLWVLGDRNGAARIQGRFDTFVKQTEIMASAQILENARKEKENAERVKSAESGRDVAIKRLRDESARISGMHVTPTPADGSERLCFSSGGLDSAVQQLITDVQGLVETGDIAIINNRAWMNSWPR